MRVCVGPRPDPCCSLTVRSLLRRHQSPVFAYMGSLPPSLPPPRPQSRSHYSALPNKSADGDRGVNIPDDRYLPLHIHARGYRCPGRTIRRRISKALHNRRGLATSSLKYSSWGGCCVVGDGWGVWGRVWLHVELVFNTSLNSIRGVEGSQCERDLQRAALGVWTRRALGSFSRQPGILRPIGTLRPAESAGRLTQIGGMLK